MRDKETLGGSVSLFLHRARLRGGSVKPLSAHSMIFEPDQNRGEEDSRPDSGGFSG